MPIQTPPGSRLEEIEALWERQDMLDEPVLPSPEDPPEDGERKQAGGSKVGNFLRGVWGIAEKGSRSILRGASGAVNALADTAGDVAERIPGVGDLGFVDWYANHAEEGLIPRDELFGPRQGGVYNFIESIAQFALPFSGFSKVLSGIKGASFIAGAATDIAAFDPYEERISNLIESGPEWVRNPLTEFLAADEDDPELLARAKAGLEGIVTGAAAEGIVQGVRALKAARAARAGKLAKEEARSIIEDAAAKAADAKGTGPALVEHADDGTARVVAKVGDEQLTLDFGADHAGAESTAASINKATEAMDAPRGRLSDAGRESLGEIARRIDEGVDLKNTDELASGLRIGVSYHQSPEEALKAIAEVAEGIEGSVSKRLDPSSTETWEETLRIADGLLGADMDATEVVARLGMLFGETRQLPAVVTAARIYLKDLGKQVAELARVADMNPSNAVAMDQLTAALDHLWDVQAKLAGTFSTTGRTLRAGKIPIEGAVDAVEAARALDEGVEAVTEGAARVADEAGEALAEGAGKAPKEAAEELAAPAATPEPTTAAAKIARWMSDGTRRVTDGMTPRQIRAMGRALVFADGDPESILNYLKNTRAAMRAPKELREGWARKILGLRVNMMLSGPKTFVVNTVSNAATAFQVPAEYWWAGVRSGNARLRQEGYDLMVGNFLNIKDALHAAKQSFAEGRNLLDVQHALDETGGIHLKGVEGFGWMSALLKMPSRALMSADEFFKQMAYRSSVRAQSLRQAAELGITDPDEIARMVADDLDMAFNAVGGGVNARALAHARTVTFTEDLQYGIGKTLQEARSRHAVFRIILPFVRTPVNLYRFVADRTPVLGRFTKRMREDLAAGGERAAIARAKQDLGTALYGMGAMLALTRQITGNGPSNPDLRRQWLAAGNQPYSIKVGGKQISYRRLEPLATPIALVADFVDALGEMREEDAVSVATALIASITASVSSKTFLIGITEFFDAVGSGEPWKVERFLTNFVASFTPNFLRQADPDPMYRETRGLLEEIQGRIPGWSWHLEPRRNIFGEPVYKPPMYFNRALNPFTTMDRPKDDDIAIQLVELGKAISMPGEQIERGQIDLTDRETYDNGTGQSPYDRMLELVANPKSGRSLREDLENLMKQPRWKNASPGTEIHPGGQKHRMAQKVVTAHYKRALAQVYREYPKLKQARREARKQYYNSLRGSVEQTERLFGM